MIPAISAILALPTLLHASPLGPAAVPAGASAAGPLTRLVAEEDPAVEAKITAAGNNTGKLLELAAECAKAENHEAASRIYKKVLSLDPANEVAHKALRHQFYDGKWFETFAELSKYQREESARMKAKGLARYKDGWVPEGDVAFLKLGWTKDDQGVWRDPFEAAQEKQIAEWTAAGRQFRADDSSWIAPEDFEKWTALLWKCGDEWLDLEKANAWHSTPGRWWQLTGERFAVWTTCEWEIGNLARWHADKTHAELVRIFGVEPKEKPHVIVLNSLDQYNQAAGGQAFPIGELEGFSSLHGAYFADGFYDPTATPGRFLGAGVSYWDKSDPKTAPWGPFWLRWAAAQSWVDAIDRSWNAIADRVAAGAGGDPGDAAVAFWSEKKIPRWLRYGAATYAERYLKDPLAAEGADPWTLREFALAELKKSGGLRKLDEVFAFPLNLADLAGSSRLYDEAGLLVAFLVDGAPQDAELAKSHQAFQAALKSGTKADAAEAVKALQAALVAREAEIRKFGKL